MNNFIIERLQQKFSEDLSFSQTQGCLVIEASAAWLSEIATFLKSNQDLAFSDFVSLFKVGEKYCYIFKSTLNKTTIALLVTGRNIPSLSRLWPKAAFLEREIGLTPPEEEGAPDVVMSPVQHHLALPLFLHLHTSDDRIQAARLEYGLTSHGVEHHLDRQNPAELIKELGMLGYAGPAAQLALLGALEQALGQEIPQGAALLRTIILELCRLGAGLDNLYKRLQLLGLDHCLKRLMSQRLALAALLTAIPPNGNFLAYPRLGGLAGAPAPGSLTTITATMEKLQQELAWLKKTISGYRSLKVRLDNLGLISKEQATHYGIISQDLRQSNPYWGYQTQAVPPICQSQSSALNRLLWLFADLHRSCQLVIKMAGLTAAQTAFSNKLSITDWADFNLPNALLNNTIVGPSGNLSVSLLLNSNSSPLALDIRGQSFFTLALLEELLHDFPLADLSHLFASFVILANEFER